jgi:hypothetical protein
MDGVDGEERALAVAQPPPLGGSLERVGEAKTSTISYKAPVERCRFQRTSKSSYSQQGDFKTFMLTRGRL